MRNLKLICFYALICFLAACSSSPNRVDFIGKQSKMGIKETWGRNEIIPAYSDDVLKYYNPNLDTRVHLDFVHNEMTVETLSNNPEEALKKALMQTLLMPTPVNSDLFGSYTQFKPSIEPYLYKKVLDRDGSPIRYEWRANRFSDLTLENSMQTRTTLESKSIYFIKIKLVAPTYVNKQAQRYLPHVKRYSKKYDVDEHLILAIMEIESNFNPTAVSRSDAIGLMQVQQHTAGKDLYRQMGKKGQPSRRTLFDPENNIMMGTAYLALIRDLYLAGIKDSLSLEYAIAASYNGGAGSVLRVFSQDRKKAIDEINKLTSEQVYHKITTKHPSNETRRYLTKVSRILKSEPVAR